MSYRKIVVDSKTYEYVVGKTHVKIKGLGVWPKQEMGHEIEAPQYCECCGTSLFELYPQHKDPVYMVVKPADVAKYISAYTI